MNIKKFWAGQLFLILLFVSPLMFGQNRPQWDDIPAGPYDIGFKVIQTYDYSRGYWPKTNARPERETARPMQIYVWYPAVANGKNKLTVFGDYINYLPSELGKERVTPEKEKMAAERMRLGPLNPYFPEGVSDSDLQEILDTPVPVAADDDPKTGNFPLVIHAGFGLIGQSVMNEYLASHGYVVAAFPVLSTHPAWYDRGEGTMEWYQAIADDIGFVHAEMRHFPSADRNRAAVIGMFAASGFLYQMQNMQLSAIASLDGQYPDILRKAPEFNLDKIRVPVLDMPSVNNAERRSMLDSMRFAQRYIVRFEKVEHPEFYQFRRIAHPEQSEEDIAYKIIARYTKAFLDGILKKDSEALFFLKQEPESAGAPVNFTSTEFLPAAKPPPTEDEFLLIIREGKIAEAERIFQDISQRLQDYQICDENSLRTIAFFYRRDHGAAASVKIFELRANMFPNSWRAGNELADIYFQTKDFESALDVYRNTLSLIDQDKSLSDERKTEMTRQIEKKIKEIE